MRHYKSIYSSNLTNAIHNLPVYIGETGNHFPSKVNLKVKVGILFRI
jgi:hypothetical protein